MPLDATVMANGAISAVAAIFPAPNAEITKVIIKKMKGRRTESPRESINDNLETFSSAIVIINFNDLGHRIRNVFHIIFVLLSTIKK